MENSDYPYHTLDTTTPWYEWLSYCETYHQLGFGKDPMIQRFMAFQRFLKQNEKESKKL